MEKLKKCKKCGKKISYNYERCRSCYIKERRSYSGVGNPNYGKKHPKINLGSKNGMWKGNKVGYVALHNYIEYHKPKPKFCEKCKKNKPYDLANISGKYKRDIDDYKWLCRVCHMNSDGRINNLIQFKK